MLYKYRSLRDFKFFVDIILKQRLYASPYFELNDPMEGQYLYKWGDLSRELVRVIKYEKEKIRICSLSRVPEHPLMWAHYADGHKGVVIGVELESRSYEVCPVEYGDNLPNIHKWEFDSLLTAKRILSHKLSVWGYEEEERVFTTKRSPYINVKVKEVRLGSKMKDKGFLRDLIERISPEINIIDSESSLPY